MKWKQNVTNCSLSLVFLPVNFETHPHGGHLRHLLKCPFLGPRYIESKFLGLVQKHIFLIRMPGYFYTCNKEESLLQSERRLKSRLARLIKVSETDIWTTCLLIWNHYYTKICTQNIRNPSQLKSWHLLSRIWDIQWRVNNLIRMGCND